MIQTKALVSTGVITVCCGLHVQPPEICCDPNDCGPCCAECPTCPQVAAKTPERRQAEAREMRWIVAEMIAMHRATWCAVEASLEMLTMSQDEIDLRTAPCSGCAGDTLVHTLDYRCDWNGLQPATAEPWPPDPVCTCGDYDEHPVCAIHVWIDPAIGYDQAVNHG